MIFRYTSKKGVYLKISKLTKNILITSTFFMAFTISIGAFAAHGLKAYIDPYMMKTFHTGVNYQFYNTLGLFAIAFVSYLIPNSKKIKISFIFILLGTLIFSFSLYALVILNMPILGAITPIGGTFMIIGWLILTYTLIKDLNIESN